MNRYTVLAGAALLLPAMSLADTSSCGTRQNNTLQKLTECVTLEGVREHQAALQTIADANNGHRVAGSAGDLATVEYIRDQLMAAGYTVELQPVQFQTFFTVTLPVLEQVAPGPAGPIANTIMSYSGSGDVTAAVTALAALPADATPGCEAADFAGFPAGNIALIRRGACTFAIKATNAFSAGASGVVIYNNAPGEINGTLGNTFSLNLPVTSVAQAAGDQLAATPGLVLRLKTDTFRGIATTHNVLAETSTGNPDNVVMIGSHLDSVNAGPGINDNGSAIGAMLETAKQLGRTRVANKVRFAWWGAEESGLVGSTYYVNTLSAEARARIALYLNFDVVASPNFVYFVYDGDDSDAVGAPAGPAGSAAIEKTFEAFYDSRGLPYKGTDLSGRSDYGPFIAAGVPSGGLFAGAEGIKTAAEAALWGGTAGVAYDPCYHQACDTFDNVSLEALDVNADAIAHATLTYAMSTQAVNGVRSRGKSGKSK
jgi:aminopeptidase Y